MQIQHVHVLLATWAFQNSHSRSGHVHNYRPRPELQTHIGPTYPLFCKFIVFENMLATRAGSTFSISSPFHVDAHATCSCLGHYMVLSIRVLIAAWAFQKSCSGSRTVHTCRPGATFWRPWATWGRLSSHLSRLGATLAPTWAILE